MGLTGLPHTRGAWQFEVATTRRARRLHWAPLAVWGPGAAGGATRLPGATVQRHALSDEQWALLEPIFKRLQGEVDEVGSIADGSVVRAHQDACGGKGGSSTMLLAALEEASPPSSTLSLIVEVNRSTSH